jgi:hypothetical protein
VRVAVLFVVLAACPSGIRRPTPGSYDRVPPESRTLFQIDTSGGFHIPGEDIDCLTALRGEVLQLDCHGHKIRARWVALADGTVSTDVMDVVMEGDPDPGMTTYRAR